MKQKILWGVVLLLNMSVVLFSSCSDDDDDNKLAKPTARITELGSGHDSPNDKQAYIGTDAHIEAEIEAEGLIKTIEVEVHQVGGSYEFGKTYTDPKYAGKKNATFHEHLDIPSEAPAGQYHLHLIVTDQLGQTATAESELILKEAEVAITIEGLVFGAGHDFSDNKIGYIGTAPVVEAASIKAGDVKVYTFHKHLKAAGAAVGEYVMEIRINDAKGASKTIKDKLTITGA